MHCRDSGTWEEAVSADLKHSPPQFWRQKISAKFAHFEQNWKPRKSSVLQFYTLLHIKTYNDYYFTSYEKLTKLHIKPVKLQKTENWELDENSTVATVVPTAWIDATPWTKSVLQSDKANLQFQRANSRSDVYYSFDRVAKVGHEGLGFHRSNIAKGTTEPRFEFCLPK